MRIHEIPIAKGYFINMSGDVFSTKNGGYRLMKAYKEESGYTVVSLRVDGKYLRKRIHQLVAETFLPNTGKLPQVNHIDGDKSNNYITNLEWCTSQHNIRHSFDTGLCVRPKGEKSHMYSSGNPHAKLILNTETGIFYDCVREAAEAHAVKRTTLNAGLTGRRRNHTRCVYA